MAQAAFGPYVACVFAIACSPQWPNFQRLTRDAKPSVGSNRDLDGTVNTFSSRRGRRRAPRAPTGFPECARRDRRRRGRNLSAPRGSTRRAHADRRCCRAVARHSVIVTHRRASSWVMARCVRALPSPLVGYCDSASAVCSSSVSTASSRLASPACAPTRSVPVCFSWRAVSNRPSRGRRLPVIGDHRRLAASSSARRG
jgi:hypothetical protein